VLAIGDEVDAVVLNINRATRKSRLHPPDHGQSVGYGAEKYPVGSRVKGIVRNFTSYGAFVELQEGIDGMIHVSDMSWTRKVNHPSEILKKADTVDVVVLEVDPSNQRISLGLNRHRTIPGLPSRTATRSARRYR